MAIGTTGFGRVMKPRIRKKFGATTVGKRIKTRARRIGFGFKKQFANTR